MTQEEIKSKIESFGKAHSQVVEALKEFPQEMLKWKPAPEKWSIHEIIIHLADSEANAFIRCRKFISEPGSILTVYDQDKLAIATYYHSQSTVDALELFKFLRIMTHNLIKMLPAETWNNKCTHPEHGEQDLMHWLNIYENHIPKHIGQMRRNFDEWNKSK